MTLQSTKGRKGRARVMVRAHTQVPFTPKQAYKEGLRVVVDLYSMNHASGSIPISQERSEEDSQR